MSMRSAFWLAALLCAFVTQLALAGTNAGFSVTLDPSEVRAPAIGDQIDIAIQIGGAVEAKHALVTARYDSSLVILGGSTPGDLIDGLVAPAGIPEQVGGGLTEVQSGGTQLGGTPGAGVGLLGMLSFYVALSGARVRRVAQLDAARLVPRQFALYANFPNPFNPLTNIEYALPEAAKVDLVIYDVLGQKVQTLVAPQLQGAGYYRLTWDGRDSAEKDVASGMYFYRLTTPKFIQTRKMMLIK